jgi:hypothetical protein
VSFDAEGVSGLLILPPEFPYADVIRLGQILKSADVLVPDYVPPAVGIYTPLA